MDTDAVEVKQLELLIPCVERVFEVISDWLKVVWQAMAEWVEENTEIFIKLGELEQWLCQEHRRHHPIPRAPLNDQRNWHHRVRAMNTRHYIRRSFPI